MEDLLLEGFAPWHFATEPSYVNMEKGIRDMPASASVYTELGLRIKNGMALKKSN